MAMMAASPKATQLALLVALLLAAGATQSHAAAFVSKCREGKDGCLQCRRNRCLKCTDSRPMYVALSGRCARCPEGCAACKKTSGQCKLCYKGLKLNAVTGKCERPLGGSYFVTKLCVAYPSDLKRSFPPLDDRVANIRLDPSDVDSYDWDGSERPDKQLRDQIVPWGQSKCWRLDINSHAGKAKFSLRIHRLDAAGKEIDSESRRLVYDGCVSIEEDRTEYCCPQDWLYWKDPSSREAGDFKAQLFVTWSYYEPHFPGQWPSQVCEVWEDDEYL